MAKYEFISTIEKLLKQNDLTLNGNMCTSLCYECGSRIYFNEENTLAYPTLFHDTRMLVKTKCPICGKVHHFELSFVNNHVNHTLRHLSSHHIFPIDIKELTQFTGLTYDKILEKSHDLSEVYWLYEKNYMLYHSYKQNLTRKTQISDMYDRKLPITDTALAVINTFCSSVSLESFLISLDIFNEKCYN